MRKLARPRWFLIGIDGRWSKYDHLFATKEEGADGVSACGVDPTEHARDLASIRYAEPDGFTDQCPGCLAWQEGVE